MKDISIFDLSHRKHTGGVTGSFAVEATDGKTYQFKPSIIDTGNHILKKLSFKQIKRQIKSNFTDRENLGEFIASNCIQDLSHVLIPNVSLVYDHQNKTTAIVSEYIQGEKSETLDQYATKNYHIPIMLKTGHIHISAKKEKDTFDISQNKLLKQQICDAIAISAICGDHDVNPGNLLMIQNHQKPSQIARIDFGHAFHDLLNAPASFGGQLQDKNNPILDFFNRDTVAEAQPGGAPSKLQRDYSGIIPSPQMVEALKKIINNKKQLHNRIEQTQKEFQMLFEIMEKNHDQQGITHILNSLTAIHSNISNQPLKKLSPQNQLSEIFLSIENFFKQQIENADKVAKIMDFQLKIDKMIEKNQLSYQELKKWSIENKFDMQHHTQWVRINHEPAFTGHLSAYIQYRKNKLAEPLENTVSYSEQYKSMRFSFKRLSQKNNDTHTEEYVQNFDPKFLIHDLEIYIKNIQQEKDVTIRFSGFSKASKQDAAQTLINYLKKNIDADTPSLNEYLPALQSGRLGDMIKKSIQPHTISNFISALDNQSKHDVKMQKN